MRDYEMDMIEHRLLIIEKIKEMLEYNSFQEMRYHSVKDFIGKRLIGNYMAPDQKLTKAAKKLTVKAAFELFTANHTSFTTSELLDLLILTTRMWSKQM